MSGRPSPRERAVTPPLPRVERFRPPLHPATLALYPRHTVLAALVAGLLTGPRWPGVVAALTAAAALGALVTARMTVMHSVPHPAREEPADPVALGADAPRRAPDALDADASRLAPDDLVVVGSRLVGEDGPPVRRRRPPPGRLAAVGVAASVAVLAGAVVGAERLRALDATQLRPQDDVEVRGFVVDAPRTRARGVRVAPVELPAVGERVLLRSEARVGWPEVRVGDEVVARGDLRALAAWEGFERRRGVHAVVEADTVRSTGRTRGSPLDAVRRRAEDAVGARLGAEQAALARGMVLGQDHALPEDLRDAFRASGLAHLVAASGTNVMLLAALVLAVATAIGVPLRPRLGLALVAVAAYVPIAGAGASIQRAGIMGAAGLVAALAGRPATRWYAVLLAAAGTLALNPRAAEDPGWQLSFAAVIAILAWHQPLRRSLVARGVPGPVADAIAVTVAATAGTAPLLALTFEQLSLVSLPANLLATPAVAPVMWLGTVSAAVGGPAAEALNALAAFPLAYLAWLARAAAAQPGATAAVSLPGPLAAAALYAALAAAPGALRRLRDRRAQSESPLDRAWREAGLAGPGRRRRPLLGRGSSGGEAFDGGALGAGPGGTRRRLSGRPLAALAVTAVGGVLLVAPGAPGPPEGFVLSLLDVGQGDAVLLQDGPHALLVDTGPPGAPLVRELRAAGVRRLDAVLITHSSADHEGGLKALLQAMPVGLVLDGRGPGREHGGEGGGARFADLPATMPRAVPAQGQRLRIGRIALDVLWPPPGDGRTGDPNATATVALARLGATTALLTADAESEVTLPLDLPDVDVLKVAHHGSDDPGLAALLERTRPETALVPVGRNTYGHPTPATLAALQRAVPTVRRTDTEGTIRLGLGP